MVNRAVRFMSESTEQNMAQSKFPPSMRRTYSSRRKRHRFQGRGYSRQFSGLNRPETFVLNPAVVDSPKFSTDIMDIFFQFSPPLIRHPRAFIRRDTKPRSQNLVSGNNSVNLCMSKTSREANPMTPIDVRSPCTASARHSRA
jgi:hypothetical protein